MKELNCELYNIPLLNLVNLTMTLGAVHILCNQFLAFFRPLPPYVINCNHLGGPPPLIKCNTVIILGLPPFLRT